MESLRRKIQENVAFDTSFLNRVKEGRINIDEEYPNSQHKRWIQDTFIDEFFFDKNGKWFEREASTDFFIRNKINLLISEGVMLHNEYHGIPVLQEVDGNYVNLFVTCDKHLAALLVYLYPDYADKIRWYDQNNLPKRHR